jgi:hypothetical protein
LAPWTGQEEHHRPGNRHGNRVPEIFLDKRKRQINTGGHTCGGVELALFYENGITFDLKILMAGLQEIAVLPMGSNPTSIE